MPFITKPITVDKPCGMKCDCCGKEFDNLCYSFKIDYTFGYGTQLDTTHVSATVCDPCLAKIIVDRIPGAIFKDMMPGHKSTIISREEVLKIINTDEEIS